MGTHIKLGPLAASFLDKDHGIRLLPGESIALPNPLPDKVRQWLMSGGLVKFEVEDAPPVQATTKIEINGEINKSLEKSEKVAETPQVDFSQLTVKELEAYALEHFGQVPEFNRKSELIEKIQGLQNPQA